VVERWLREVVAVGGGGNRGEWLPWMVVVENIC
jgi:hypothetical protein